MKDYIRKRVLEIGEHILATKHTVRQAAVVFGVSKSTVHKEHSKWNGREVSSLTQLNLSLLAVEIPQSFVLLLDRRSAGLRRAASL